MNDYFTSQISFSEVTHWLYHFNMTLQIIIIDEAMCPTARIKSEALKSNLWTQSITDGKISKTNIWQCCNICYDRCLKTVPQFPWFKRFLDHFLRVLLSFLDFSK